MAITSGFFNSVNGDRKYDATQMSSIFDGLIVDGVFASIGNAFNVKAAGGLNLTVDTGKAWFNHTWTLNDSVLQIVVPEAELLLDRIDAVILEINNSESVRKNDIKIVKGTASSSAIKPALQNEGNVHQHPICYIFRKAGSSSIAQADITMAVGTEETPFVTGILQTISLDELLGKWQDELDTFVANESAKINDWTENEESELTAWLNTMKADLQSEKTLLDNWVAAQETDFLAWYNRMKGQLDEDAAGNLQLSIDKEEIKRILLNGLEDGTKSISEDGTVITQVATDGRKLTKTFINDFSTMISVLESSSGAEIARLMKVFYPDGKKITSRIQYS